MKKEQDLDLTGKYLYTPSKQEYKSLRKPNRRKKQVFSIRLGDNVQSLWVNHNDYTTYRTDYSTSNDGLIFEYNKIQYVIKNDIKHDNNNMYKFIQFYSNK